MKGKRMTQKAQKVSQPEPEFDPVIIDQLLAGRKTQEDFFGENGLIRQLTKHFLEKALQAELTHHLGHGRHESVGNERGNARNGKSKKTIQGEFGKLDLEIPRDRDSSFEPVLVSKHQRRFTGLDDKILALYARGMSTRLIQETLQDLYGVEVDSSLISTVTDGVLEGLKAWQNRVLEGLYAVIILDCIFIKVRDNGQVSNKAVYVAIGISLEGYKDVLGLWLEKTEGAKFWLSILTELKHRGVKDVLIACVDGLKGFPEAIEAVFPRATVQTCIVHLIRHSLKFVVSKDREAVVKDLKSIYQALTLEMAELGLEDFARTWDNKYPAISQTWRKNWSRVIPYLSYPLEVRKVVYTTNAVESLNSQLRRSVRSHGAFPTEEAALKVLYLTVSRAIAKWSFLPVKGWKEAYTWFTLYFADRLSPS
jgi:putative transposase